ncbi:MAG TPA: MBOAT family protein [Bacteroidetes bacterium]|nr:MBOAT family protein [Bacteroidota bacterium]
MLFNSFQFLIFFPIVVALYFALPHRYRWALLLAASYYFYACWRVEYLTLIIASTLVDYFSGIQIGKSRTRRRKSLFLGFSLFANLGMLFAFKYFNFFSRSVHAVLAQFNILYAAPELNVLLPVGISFYTFQTLSYTIDLYLGKREQERHAGIFAVYVAFFPQLVAGPIERSTRLLPQFFEKHGFDRARAVEGLKLMLWGFFKKVAIADRLAYYVNTVYARPGDQSGLSLLLATVFFAFQIYCDFSGYSDIAIGAAKVMGFDLMTNFRQPYFSRSIREFWRRWHISLSTWFRDYVFIPLGGSRVAGALALYRNLMVTFVVSGMWHGANWTFVIWGGLHGLYMIVSIATARIRNGLISLSRIDRSPALLDAWRVFVTFNLVLAAWVFFRAADVSDAWLILSKISSSLLHPSVLPGQFASGFPAAQWRDIMFILAVLTVMNLYDWARWRGFRFLRSPLFTTFEVSTQFWFIAIFGMFNNQQFIYFQF